VSEQTTFQLEVACKNSGDEEEKAEERVRKRKMNVQTNNCKK